MRFPSPLGLACFLMMVCGSLKTPAAGLTGRAALSGDPPPEKEIVMDQLCAALQTNVVTTRHYVMGPKRGLANVTVFVRAGLPKTFHAAPTNALTLEFTRCRIEPYVSAARTKQAVKFSSTHDRVLHNLHTHSRASGEGYIAMPKPGVPSVRRFERPEMFIRSKCDVHPWEFAYLSVFDHPFYAVTAADGTFTLPPGLPDGPYTIEARHSKAGSLTHPVIVSKGTAHIPDFIFQVLAAK
jgi:hypothetical protein